MFHQFNHNFLDLMFSKYFSMTVALLTSIDVAVFVDYKNSNGKAVAYYY